MDVQATEEVFSRSSSTSKTFVYFLWAIFALLDPDPDSDSESGSTDLIESGSETLVPNTHKVCKS
jgi:hypothetical protein